MRVGQTIAIPVLDRHIKTSSGKCRLDGTSLKRDCVMADALRDLFPGARSVSVDGAYSDVTDAFGQNIWLRHHDDMRESIGAFDTAIDEVRDGITPLKDVILTIRGRIPRVVHATIEVPA